MAKSKKSLGDTRVNRSYRTRNGRNVFTWRVFYRGELIARSARSYQSTLALNESIVRTRKLLAAVFPE